MRLCQIMSDHARTSQNKPTQAQIRRAIFKLFVWIHHIIALFTLISNPAFTLSISALQDRAFFFVGFLRNRSFLVPRAMGFPWAPRSLLQVPAPLPPNGPSQLPLVTASQGPGLAVGRFPQGDLVPGPPCCVHQLSAGTRT